MKRSTVIRFITRSLPLTALTLASACKGPEPEQRVVPLNIPERGAMVVQWPDGPRRDNAELVLQRSAEEYAGQLFKGEPMARDLPAEAQAQPSGAASEDAPPTLPDGEYPKPVWADGVPKPADVAENDMPRAWPVEVRLGETPQLLAEWSGGDGKQILTDNAEMLGKRRWLKTGDRISVTMTPNQKVGFDRARDAFQKQRVDAFFSRRYFEKVVVYRVKRGEYISAAAKRYGDVPLWLIEEFNQTDFRGLQPGDEILIPIVSTLQAGRQSPPPLTVVDEEGHPIADGTKPAIDARLKGDFMARARLALDDSNVFMRSRPPGGAAPAPPAPVGERPAVAGGAPAPGFWSSGSPGMAPPSPAAAYAAPPSEGVVERRLPAASIGSHDYLPDYGGGGAYAAGRVEGAQRPVAMGAQHGVVVPAAPEGVAGAASPRDIVVKRGESLMHYVKWSKTPLDDIKVANPHLLPERIFVGARVAIPMSDAQYVEFVKARAAWEKEKETGAASGEAKAPSAVKKHTVKAGDTATSIARKHKVALKDLKAANPKVNLKKLSPGTKLVIPQR